jgi:hypothetical protein
MECMSHEELGWKCRKCSKTVLERYSIHPSSFLEGTNNLKRSDLNSIGWTERSRGVFLS